jgi:hypothetical protein
MESSMPRVLPLALAPLLALVPATAAAEPCGIRLVRAPEELRAAVEAHLAADQSACAGELDVWLIPTAEGLYVQARDRLGRLRERVVADAATAATLLASWVEVDAAEPLWTPPPGELVAAPEEPAATPAPPVRVAAAPGVTPIIEAPPPAPRRRDPNISVAVAALAQRTGTGMDGGGLRVQADLARRGVLHVGVALTGSVLGAASVWFPDTYAPAEVREGERMSAELGVTLASSLPIGRVTFRPEVSVGAAYGHHDLDHNDGGSWYRTDLHTLGPRGAVSMAASTRVIGP